MSHQCVSPGSPSGARHGARVSCAQKGGKSNAPPVRVVGPRVARRCDGGRFSLAREKATKPDAVVAHTALRRYFVAILPSNDLTAVCQEYRACRLGPLGAPCAANTGLSFLKLKSSLMHPMPQDMRSLDKWSALPCTSTFLRIRVQRDRQKGSVMVGPGEERIKEKEVWNQKKKNQTNQVIPKCGLFGR